MRRMEHIGKVLDSFLRASQLEHRVAEYRVVLQWPDLVGKEMARQTEALELRRGTLWVRAASSVWTQHILFLKPKLLDRMRREFPGVEVRDIRCVIRARRSGARDGHD